MQFHLGQYDSKYIDSVYSPFLLGMNSTDINGVTTAQHDALTNNVKGA